MMVASLMPSMLTVDTSQIRVLAENPERWSKIFALSRRPPSGKWPNTVEHIPLDFLQTPEEIAKVLKHHNVKPDYVFFFSYLLVTDENGSLQWGDQRLVDRNSEYSTMMYASHQGPNA